MCAPSTSASVAMMILWYRSLERSNTSPMAVPIATTSARISTDASMRSILARSTFKILPRSGRIACVRRSRPCLEEPPAESPSTMKSSPSSALLVWQSASFPGSVMPSSAPLRSTESFAALAALRAFSARVTLLMMARASSGFSSRYAANASPNTVATAPCASTEPSFAFVWPSNCTSRNFTETTAVMPSSTSSPVKFSSFSFRRFAFLP